MDYAIPNVYAEYVMLETPIPVGFWRSVGDSSNPFTVESFIDELAHLGRKDPVKFRLSMLKNNPRGRRVLELLAEKSGWGKPIKKRTGSGHRPANLLRFNRRTRGRSFGGQIQRTD